MCGGGGHGTSRHEMSHSMSHDDEVAWWADGGEGGRQQPWCKSQHMIQSMSMSYGEGQRISRGMK